MNKYVYAEAFPDYWPQIKTISAASYNDAVERLINQYGEEFEDDFIFTLTRWDTLRDYLNEKYCAALSEELEIYEEI